MFHEREGKDTNWRKLSLKAVLTAAGNLKSFRELSGEIHELSQKKFARRKRQLLMTKFKIADGWLWTKWNLDTSSYRWNDLLQLR